MRMGRRKTTDEDRWAPPEEEEIHPYLGDVEAQAALEALDEGRYEPFAQLYAKHPHRWWLDELAGSGGEARRAAILRWDMNQPSAWTRSMRGAHLIVKAWDYRGRSQASQVGANQWRPFHAVIDQAEDHLRTTAALYPDSPLPWIHLLTTGRALSVDTRELRARFGRIQELEPYRPDACAIMLQGLCAKWSGSNDEMFDFARWVAANTPADSAAQAVLGHAYFEWVLDQGAPTHTLLTQTDAAAELQSAAERFLSATPEWTPPYLLDAANIYAFTVIPVNHTSKRISTELFRRIGERPTSMPWSYFGSLPITKFREVRALRQKQAAAITGGW